MACKLYIHVHRPAYCMEPNWAHTLYGETWEILFFIILNFEASISTILLFYLIDL